MMVITVIIIRRNGNRTEWSTIQGVIERVVSNQLSALQAQFEETAFSMCKVFIANDEVIILQ